MSPTRSTPGFPVGGVIVVIVGALIIVQLIGGDLTGRLLSWYDHLKPAATSGTLNNAGQQANLQPVTPSQVGGPLGAGVFLPKAP